MGVSIYQDGNRKEDLTSEIDRILPMLEQKITQAMHRTGIPGLVMGIVSRDHVYYQKAFGVKKLGAADKVTPTTLFQVASLSKPISATLLTILQEKGKVSFQDALSRFIPTFSKMEDQEQVKVWHLLSHSSGFSGDHVENMIESSLNDSPQTRQNIINKVLAEKPVAQPGEVFSYHNVMFGVLEDVITQTTGNAFADVIQETFFRPLGMNQACTGWPALHASQNRAFPHMEGGNKSFVPAQDYSKAYYMFSPAVGINASLEDFIPFLQLYLGKFPHILSKSSIEQITKPRVDALDVLPWFQGLTGEVQSLHYGLGWYSMIYNNRPLICHAGWLDGFVSFIGFDPDAGLGTIMMMNADSDRDSKLSFAFYDLFFAPNR